MPCRMPTCWINCDNRPRHRLAWKRKETNRPSGASESGPAGTNHGQSGGSYLNRGLLCGRMRPKNSKKGNSYWKYCRTFVNILDFSGLPFGVCGHRSVGSGWAPRNRSLGAIRVVTARFHPGSERADKRGRRETFLPEVRNSGGVGLHRTVKHFCLNSSIHRRMSNATTKSDSLMYKRSSVCAGRDSFMGHAGVPGCGRPG